MQNSQHRPGASTTPASPTIARVAASDWVEPIDSAWPRGNRPFQSFAGAGGADDHVHCSWLQSAEQYHQTNRKTSDRILPT
jgi:hypothetical protein